MVFALDDLRHFYTVERYLEDQYKNTGLFHYLANSSLQYAHENSKDPLITRCDMPLPFIRTLQYSKILFDIVLDKRSPEELAVPVNKNKELLTKEYAGERFYDESFKEGLRIKQKFDKIADFNEEFINQNDRQQLEKAMASFSLNGFKDRISKKNVVLPVANKDRNQNKSTRNPEIEASAEQPQSKRRKSN